ncbi:MAG: hypothetical protein JWP91_1345 [Fibrobacteres bacterium]|nr:hypothetical protein [Fibrobacterota bacterium]
MKSVLAVMVLWMNLNASSQVAKPGCHWVEIKEINARIMVPDGWSSKKKSEKKIIAIEVVPSGPNIGDSAKSLYRMEIKKGLAKNSIVEVAKLFVESARRKETKDAQELDEQQYGKMKTFSLVVQYPSQSIEGYQRSVARSAIANPTTGTLVLVDFDIPGDEIKKVAPMGNYLFRESVFDDDY